MWYVACTEQNACAHGYDIMGARLFRRVGNPYNFNQRPNQKKLIMVENQLLIAARDGELGVEEMGDVLGAEIPTPFWICKRTECAVPHAPHNPIHARRTVPHLPAAGIPLRSSVGWDTRPEKALGTPSFRPPWGKPIHSPASMRTGFVRPSSPSHLPGWRHTPVRSQG
jgi:hypothetical protein